MKSPVKGLREQGQALSEMLVALPLLLLMSAGMVQFGFLFLTYVQFDHACGEAARLYAAGIIDKDSMGPMILDQAGYFRRFLEQDSLRVSAQEPRSVGNAILGPVSGFVSTLNAVANSLPLSGKAKFDAKYEGWLWTIDVRCAPPAFFRFLFPNGVPFHSTLQVYRFGGAG